MLVAGGSLNSGPANVAEIHDPATGATTMASIMAGPFVWSSYVAVPLNDGRVLIFGGNDGQFHNLNSAELYTP